MYRIAVITTLNIIHIIPCHKLAHFTLSDENFTLFTLYIMVKLKIKGYTTQAPTEQDFPGDIGFLWDTAIPQGSTLGALWQPDTNKQALHWDNFLCRGTMAPSFQLLSSVTVSDLVVTQARRQGGESLANPGYLLPLHTRHMDTSG